MTVESVIIHHITRLIPHDGCIHAAVGFIHDESGWVEMIDDRNLTVHTYNEEFARELAGRIRDRYLPLLRELAERLAR